MKWGQPVVPVPFLKLYWETNMVQSQKVKIMIIYHPDQSKESNNIKAFQILQGIYPVPEIETLRFTQGDMGEGFRMTKRDLLRNH